MNISNKEQVREPLDEVYKAIEDCAKTKLEEISKPDPYIDLTKEEHAILKKLVETEIGHVALEKLLVDCGKSNLTSTLTLITISMANIQED
jgi:hypothetical protein